ncbi:mitochondrial import inner membrane translocase subunit Tim8 B [Pelmatolapia mariae]
MKHLCTRHLLRRILRVKQRKQEAPPPAGHRVISAVSQTAPVEEKVTSVLEQCSELLCSRRSEDMDGFDNLSASEKAEATELQRMIAVEQQKAQFQAQVHSFTDVCWDKCVDTPGSKLDYRTETCLVSCVERFIDTTLSITNRFTQMVQKGTQ